MTKFLKPLRVPVLAFLASLFMWSIVSWPLPRLADDAIAMASRRPSTGATDFMTPGDHLQMLYHLWLGHDTFFGDTPWATNLYEFNTGDDAARKSYSTYYLPFSLFYSLGHVAGGHALGYNLAGLLSLFVSVWTTWLLLRRWIPDRPVVIGCATLLGQAIPYRWHTLFNGSPTGLSLMWVPVLLLGVDIWLRDHRARGAALAGAAVFFSGWSDLHVLFFSALLAPGWAVANLVALHGRRLLEKKTWIPLLRSAWPLAVWMALVGVQALRLTRSMQGTTVEEGREAGEVAIFAPRWIDVVSRESFGGLEEIYLGTPLLVVLLAGYLALAWRARRVPALRPPLFLFSVLAAGTLAITLLATGANHPLGPIWWERTLRLLPPLEKMRQPSKIFLLLPPLISLMAGLAFARLPRRAGRIAAPLITLVCGWTLLASLHPWLCVLSKQNLAYDAVVEEGDPPHMLGIPLWPGDSHWTSIKQYYAMTHRLRMVNGYKPSRIHAYMEEVYLPLESVNLGRISTNQIERLRAMGVTHLVLHENAFPEKVSPFSVGRTLSRLLTHPRFALSEQDGPVWAFRLLDEPREPPPPPPWRLWGAKQSFNAESGILPLARVEDSRRFAGGAAVELTPHTPPLRMSAGWTDAADPLHLLVRAYGRGHVRLDISWGDLRTTRHLDLDASDLRWVSLPLPTGDVVDEIRIHAEAENGRAIIDTLQVVPAEWDPAPGEPVEFYPTSFFHAGYTDLDTNQVVFRPDRDPAAAIFYGPNLALEPGRYRVELRVSSPAPPDTRLGTLRLRPHPPSIPETAVTPGRSATLEFSHDGRSPFSLEFNYAGEAPMFIDQVRLVPLSQRVHT